jgi:hypothetical protein
MVLKGEELICSHLYLFLMFQTRPILLALAAVLLAVGGSCSPVDITIEREYYGEYTSRQAGVGMQAHRVISGTWRSTPAK